MDPMDGTGIDGECAEMTCHGDAIWHPIEAHLAKHGAQTMMERFKSAHSDEQYKAWLAGMLEVSGDASGDSPWTDIPDGAQGLSGTLSLAAFPPDHSRARALRAVEFNELKEKAQAIILAQSWRHWDVLQISRTPGTTGIDGTFIEDMHIRLCSLGALFIMHWEQQWPVPPFLQSMGCRIPVQYLGHATRTVALARAVKNCASLQFGVTHLGWLDIVLQVVQCPDKDGHIGGDLQAQVMQICPEYARKINSWQHMGNICSRVDAQCFVDADAVLAAHGIPKAILPQTWFRESFFLQSPKKRTAKSPVGLEPQEQRCATQRMMTAVVEAWKSSGNSLSQNALSRMISGEDLKKYATLAKKYVAGMTAQERDTGISAFDTLAAFASGSCDGYLMQARDESMAAYWPWVLAAKAEKRSLAEAEAVEEAKQTAEKAAKEEEDLRREVEQMQVDEDDAVADLRSRREETTAKLVAAARSLHAVNLRAYYSTLQHFVNEHVPIAMKLWQDRATRAAADDEFRAKSLEDMVFKVMPESEPFCSEAWFVLHDTALPVVPYLDLNQGVPDVAAVLPKLQRSGGVVIAFVAGPPGNMASLMETEKKFTQQLPGDANVYRVFIRGIAQPSPAATDGAGFVGWVSLVHSNGTLSAFQARVLASPAITQGCLLKFAADSIDEHARPKSGHDLCPDQRPISFHARLLQGLGVVTNFMVSGTLPMDFFLVEYETCTSSLARFIVQAALAHAKAAPTAGTAAQVHLATQVKKLEEARPSFSFRNELVAEVRASLRPLVVDRKLKRAKSNADADMHDLAAKLPCAPALPPKLSEYLEGTKPCVCNRLPHLVAIGQEYYDRSRAKLPTRTLEAADKFENSAPEGIVSAVACTKAGLLVAPSMYVCGELGLFSARAFSKGEVICQGSSIVNGWGPTEGKPSRPQYTLSIVLKHVFFQTKDVSVQLVGDPSRNLWTAMNSTEGIESGVQPNVAAVFGDGDTVVMDNSFLSFRAARDIPAFEELLWRYAWAESATSDSVEPAAHVTPSNAVPVVSGDPLSQLPSVPQEAAAGEGPTEGDVSTHNPQSDEEAPPSKEDLVTDGLEIARDKAFTAYFFADQIVIAFEKPVKRMPGFSVTVMSDKCRSTNEWKRVEYKLTPNSKVQVNSDTLKLKDALGDVISDVWGYQAADCKQRRSSTDGEIKPLFWAPKQKDMALCNALMDIYDRGMGSSASPIFVMEVDRIDDATMLAPKGVTFAVKARSLTAAQKQWPTVVI